MKNLHTALLAAVVLAVFLAGSASAQDSDKVRELSTKARDALIEKDYDKAIKLYKQVLKILPENTSALYNIACAYSLRGKKKKAIEHLKKAVAAGFEDYQLMKGDPDLAPLRKEEEFKKLLEEIKKKSDKTPEQIIAALKAKLGDGYAYKTDREYRLVIASNIPSSARGDQVAILRKVADCLWRWVFKNKPEYYITVIIPRNPQDFHKLLGPAYRDAAGMYSHSTKTLYVNVATGGGTTSHEFTHALHYADRSVLGQEHPLWITEGFGSLYEQADFKKVDGDDRLFGLTNWRLPRLQRYFGTSGYTDWETLIKSTHRDRARFGSIYATTRYIFYYLQEKGLLLKFYKDYCKNYRKDPSGKKALEKVLGCSIAKAEKEWKKWVMTLTYGRSGRPARKPMMGVRFDRDHSGGAKINEVVDGSPADRGGMKAGDVVVEMDGKPIKSYDDISEVLKTKERGDEATFKVERDGEELTITIKLGVYPEDEKK